VQGSGPSLATAGGADFQEERLSTRLVVSAALVLGGIAAAILARRHAHKP
jgi:hypothetical protein